MMKRLRITLAVLGMLALSACAQGIGATKAAITLSPEFNIFFLEDVKQATLMAKRTNDSLALHCWSYLEEFAIENAPDLDVPQGDVVGALSAYQKARNVRRTIIEVKISDAFRLRCGPMLTDSAGALGRLVVSLPVPSL